ncbi:histone-lysine N-methyltransferase EZ3-like [Vigna umbellata]|uniref:histone-lysine N-methyltransferase EZ3-like n=1 Tax=Vigna umbellata TaxID=87088 RepID=UPI001F5E9641|nr:histone-lysine N-methyltransferase EZ3-like [Vigna umbellata]
MQRLCYDNSFLKSYSFFTLLHHFALVFFSIPFFSFHQSFCASMVNRIPSYASKYHKQQGKSATEVSRRSLKTKIKVLADKYHAERGVSVKEKVHRHWRNLEPVFPTTKRVLSGNEYLQVGENVNKLSLRIDNPLCKFNGFPEATLEEDQFNDVEISAAESTRIPKEEKLPTYTAWVYVARNEKMAKDQSVIGKYQMYYDKDRGEMMICSDNEEEIPNTQNVEHEFTEAEDQILRMTLEEYGTTKEVLGIIEEIFETDDSQIQERYEKLKEKSMESLDQHSKDCHCKGCQKHFGVCLKKGLGGTLETFDKIFCRRCLIFDCAIHGTDQPLIYLSEKHVCSEPEVGRKPCSDQCYLLDKGITPMEEDTTLPPNEPQSSCELKRTSDDIIIDIGNHYSELNLDASDNENHTTSSASLESLGEHASKKLPVSGSFDHGERDKGVMNGQEDLTMEIEFNEMPISKDVQTDKMMIDSDWRPLERDLYLKGVEMFGKNSCLIAATFFHGLKTCLQVASYMFSGGESMIHGSTTNSIVDRNENINAEFTDLEMSSRSRSQRKKGKPRKFNYTRKSAGLPPRWRKIAYGQNMCNKQYTPCGCHGMCGKECSCLLNGTCCEKYCGCSKICTNRFRGCHCTKSQCRSRLCPCFAANRECDPDVCRNCWVSCGDGSLGEPPRRGDSKCGNMNILLGQKERILLAKSDVVGWGAFAKNPINKNVCLGEYKGELIPPKEAEKRGKLYDRVNTSFLFNLNNEWVIDAHRLGDKLKFANHSSKPNCYAKVMLVGGEHRVGIYAKENIEAGDEIFYDYWYDLECAPSWALPPEDNASKKDELGISQSKAKKR